MKKSFFVMTALLTLFCITALAAPTPLIATVKFHVNYPEGAQHTNFSELVSYYRHANHSFIGSVKAGYLLYLLPGTYDFECNSSDPMLTNEDKKVGYKVFTDKVDNISLKWGVYNLTFNLKETILGKVHKYTN